MNSNNFWNLPTPILEQILNKNTKSKQWNLKIRTISRREAINYPNYEIKMANEYLLNNTRTKFSNLSFIRFSIDYFIPTNWNKITSFTFNLDYLDYSELKVLLFLKNLTRLKIFYDHCDLHGLKINTLFEALKASTTLTELTLIESSGGYLTNAYHIQALANFLKVNTSLIILDLQSELVTPKDVIDLIEALKSNTTLTTLDLSESFGIDPDGVIALRKGLNANVKLKIFN